MTSDELRRLSIADRLELIEDLWVSITDNSESVSVPPWHRDTLDKRISTHEREPGAAQAWDEVKAEIGTALRK